MKKHNILTPFVFASAMLLAACGGNQTTSTPAPTSSETPDPVSSSVDEGPLIKEATEIQIWSTFNANYQAILDNVVNDLKKEEPNLTVTITKQSTGYDGLHDMVLEGFPANNYPDITVAYPDSVADYLDYGKALNMEDYMYNNTYGWTEDDLDDIPTGYLDEGRNYSVMGTYSLPLAKSTEALYYNEDILIGLDLKSIDAEINGGEPIDADYMDNLTWEELFNHLAPALIKYNDVDDKHVIFDKSTYPDTWSVLGYDSDSNLFITLAEQYGYGYTSLNKTTGEGSIDFVNDGMKSLMKTLRSAKDNHYIQTQGTFGTYTNYGFTTGAMLMTIGSTGGVSYQFSSSNPMNVGVAHIPHAAGKDPKVIQQGPSFAFLDHQDSNRALGSWLFYKKFATAKYSSQWTLATGYMPLRYSVGETADYQAYCDYKSKADKTEDRLLALNACYTVEAISDFYSSPVFKGSSAARTYAGSLLTDCLTKADLDANIDEFFETAKNNVLAKM